MKYPVTFLGALALLLCCAHESLGHRVNLFAYVDGDAIQVECFFSKSRKVRHGKLVFTDLVTGAGLFEGTTDEQGLFRFRPDPEFLGTGHGLNILLDAGEGHQSNWQVSSEELQVLSPAASSQLLPNEGRQAKASLGQVAENRIKTAAPEATELEAMIGRVMDVKLAPIKLALARQEDSGPEVKDIVGGLGWILGLLGLATYMKYKQ